MKKQLLVMLAIMLIMILMISTIFDGVSGEEIENGTGTVTVLEAIPPGIENDPSTLGFTFDPQDYPSLDPNVVINPVSEWFNLSQYGTLNSPYISNLTEDFEYITSISWTLTFTATVLDVVNKFAVNNELPNGINVYYNNESLLDHNNITTTEDFSNQEFSAYNYVILTDELDNREMIAKWLYLDTGLRISPARTYQIYIQDDLQSLQNVTEFSATIEGYQLYTLDPENPDPKREDFLTILENFFRDNGINLLLLSGTFFSLILIVRFFKRK
jgi:hypothetical protein